MIGGECLAVEMSDCRGSTIRLCMYLLYSQLQVYTPKCGSNSTLHYGCSPCLSDYIRAVHPVVWLHQGCSPCLSDFIKAVHPVVWLHQGCSPCLSIILLQDTPTRTFSEEVWSGQSLLHWWGEVVTHSVAAAGLWGWPIHCSAAKSMDAECSNPDC